jgi:TetR/AcrR family tetracycline transcriptional repressor
LCGFATLELSTEPSGVDDTWPAAVRAQLDNVDAARHPHFARHASVLRNRAFLLRWAGGRQAPLASGFEAWIDVILRGLEARLGASMETVSRAPRVGGERPRGPPAR